MIQVVVMDNKNYILEFKDFTLKQIIQLSNYVIHQVRNPEACKIDIIKWP
jgi:hypothetical protein